MEEKLSTQMSWKENSFGGEKFMVGDGEICWRV